MKTCGINVLLPQACTHTCVYSNAHVKIHIHMHAQNTHLDTQKLFQENNLAKPSVTTYTSLCHALCLARCRTIYLPDYASKH